MPVTDEATATGARMRRLAALALIALAAPPAAMAAAVPAAVEQAGSAAAELERALEAMGGPARLASAASISWDTTGKLYWLNQGPTPAQPMAFQLRQWQHSDLEAGLTYVLSDFSGPESTFRRTTVLRHADRSEELLELLAISPASVVRHLAARPADLRLVSRNAGSAVIAGPLMGRMVELELDAQRLPRALAYVFVDDLMGDATRRFEYRDYQQRDGWNVPGRVRQLDAGRIVRDAAVARFAFGQASPEWTRNHRAEDAHPPGTSAGFSAELIAPGIHFLKQHGDDDYHGLAVELANGWMVLETPYTIGDGTDVRKALNRISAKPIVYAAATHHHDDHSAGISAFRDDPVTVLTTPGNVDFFRTMMAAPRGFSRVPTRARVVAVPSRHTIGPVQFLTIDASPHVREMLLFYFPEQRILFHSDLGRFNADSSAEPARPQGCALWSYIRRNNLAVDNIYSGHGRPGTIEDLRKSIALRDTPCPAN